MSVFHVAHCLPPSCGPLGRTELTLTAPDGGEHRLVYNGLLDVERGAEILIDTDEEDELYFKALLRYAR